MPTHYLRMGPDMLKHQRVLHSTICLAAIVLLLLATPLKSNGQELSPIAPFEQSNGNQSPTYEQTIAFYRSLAESSQSVSLHEMGLTDSGRALQVAVIADPAIEDLAEVPTDKRAVLLVNNAIHPGEPDGVDASMMLAADLVSGRQKLPSNVIVAIIPMYNIGGALNRNSTTRANQNGPLEYGFRGNARNLDLNRDFIKCDSRNARSFARIFRTLDPDVFIDTHVSNGADYQHVMTSAHSQHNKLGLQLGEYFDQTFEPTLFDMMKDSGFPTVPYVNSGGGPPDRGFSQFLETPRYSTGYAALFQTFGFMTETHMLKDYSLRVKATRAFLDHTVSLLSKQADTIQSLRTQDRRRYLDQKSVPIAWEVDRSAVDRLEFHGYEASFQASKVTSGQRLFYDRMKPFVKDIPFYGTYRVSKSVDLPAGYLIPQGWHDVIALMKLNGVQMRRIEKEAELETETYRITSETSRSAPYEGHYFHDQVVVEKERSMVRAQPGDVVITIRQPAARYVVETLEPEAMDSLFRWNFFDSILQRKEHFSPYVFEEIAANLLAENDALKQEFEKRRKSDSEFNADRFAQLSFLYERSPHNEPAYRIYPVRRLMKLPEIRN